jgi:hypothetical protein
MGKYGATAVRSVELLLSGSGSADAAWNRVVKELFDGPDAQRKSCPREAFLGLCEAGLIAGVPSDACNTTGSPGRNRMYAIAATRLLLAEPRLAHEGKAKLWRRVISAAGDDPGKRENAQLDVVLSL